MQQRSMCVRAQSQAPGPLSGSWPGGRRCQLCQSVVSRHGKGCPDTWEQQDDCAWAAAGPTASLGRQELGAHSWVESWMGHLHRETWPRCPVRRIGCTSAAPLLLSVGPFQLLCSSWASFPCPLRCPLGSPRGWTRVFFHSDLLSPCLREPPWRERDA